MSGPGVRAAALRRLGLLGAVRCCPRSGCRSIARLSGREFAEAIGFFGGLSAEVIADDEMRDLLLPGVIADFRMAVGYRYAAGRAARRPGHDRGRAAMTRTCGQAQVEPWSREFARPVDQRWVDGGHFYFEPDPAPITGILRRDRAGRPARRADLMT